MSYTLMCAPSDQSDTEMGGFATVGEARAALAVAMAEWDAQGGETPAGRCRWYVWDDEARTTVDTLHEPARIGRPPLPPEQRAEPTQPRSVRLTDAEWAELQRRGVRGGSGTLVAWLARKRA